MVTIGQLQRATFVPVADATINAFDDQIKMRAATPGGLPGLFSVGPWRSFGSIRVEVNGRSCVFIHSHQPIICVRGLYQGILARKVPTSTVIKAGEITAIARYVLLTDLKEVPAVYKRAREE